MSSPYNKMRKIETRFKNMLNGEDSFELIVWTKLCKHPVWLWFNSDTRDKTNFFLKVKLYKDLGTEYELIEEYYSLQEFKNKRKELF